MQIQFNLKQSDAKLQQDLEKIVQKMEKETTLSARAEFNTNAKETSVAITSDISSSFDDQKITNKKDGRMDLGDPDIEQKEQITKVGIALMETVIANDRQAKLKLFHQQERMTMGAGEISKVARLKQQYVPAA